MKSSECMNGRFFKQQTRKLSGTSKAASFGPTSQIKLSPHLYSLRLRTAGAEKLASRTTCCKTFGSVENLSMAPYNHYMRTQIQGPHRTPAKDVSFQQSSRLLVPILLLLLLLLLLLFFIFYLLLSQNLHSILTNLNPINIKVKHIIK